MSETMQHLLRFGDDILDLSEVVALVGRTVHLRDGLSFPRHPKLQPKAESGKAE